MAGEKRDLYALLKIVRKYNLKETEEVLRQEANLEEIEDVSDSDVNSVLAFCEGERNPEILIVAYADLRNFVENCLDIFKHELTIVLYPILCQMYLKLMSNGHEEQAKVLLQKYGPEQEYYYQDDIKQLLLIKNSSQMENNDLVTAFESEKFVVRISRDSLSLLKRHIQEKKSEAVSQIINKHLHFDLYEGATRSKGQCQATAGAIIGEAKRQDNKVRVYYGLLKEMDFQTLTTPPEEDDDGEADAPDKPKKKKQKKDPLFSKKSKSDPNAPPHDRIPLLELKDADKLEKIKALRESTKRVNLGRDTLPSVCMYTLLNAGNNAICADICDDSSMIAVGFYESYIKVWTLTPAKLRGMKGSEHLKEIDRDADDVFIRMMDDRVTENFRTLYGHSGSVFNCSFSPDKSLLLSCSEDCSIRLWSLCTWTCLVVYKGHVYPVWDIKFSPHNYYFATASYDKTARLWTTESNQPLRFFVGHLADVDCITFHPNSNYVATGSSDRTVRLWDCLTGNYVRLMTGHKSAIYSLAFSICGRYLASGSSDLRILIWDMSNGQLVCSLPGHTGTIHCLSFSRNGNLLVSGSLDCALKIWDFEKLCIDYTTINGNLPHKSDVKDGESYMLRSFPTKSTPFMHLHFTRRNLLLGVGTYKGT